MPRKRNTCPSPPPGPCCSPPPPCRSRRSAPTPTPAPAAAASVNVATRDESQCSQFNTGVQNWQCTPVLIAVGTPTQSVSTGGTLSLNGFATCEYRKRADGFTNDWSSWTSCGPYSKSASAWRSWGIGGAPQGALVQLTWPTIQNAETAFVTDCVEIRTSISSSATATSAVESVYGYTRFPASGSNLSGICEGGSAYSAPAPIIPRGNNHHA